MGSISSGSSSSDGSERKPWQQLMRAFLDRVALPVTAEEADGIWRMFAGDAWFLEELRRQAGEALRARRRPAGWANDVAHEALVRFREQLRKTPDLGVDRARVQKTFPTWMAARLRFASNDAIDFLHRLHGREAPAETEPADARPAPPIDLWIDVRMAVGRFEEPVRSALLLLEAGFPVQEIAERIGRTYAETRRMLERGLGRLALQLRDYRPTPHDRQSSSSAEP